MVLTDIDRKRIREMYRFPKKFKGPSAEEVYRTVAALENGSSFRHTYVYVGTDEDQMHTWRDNDEDFDRICRQAVAFTVDLVARRVFEAAVTLSPKTGAINTGAAIFWLKNRSPDEWMDALSVLDGDKKEPSPFDEMTEDTMRRVGGVLKSLGLLDE